MAQLAPQERGNGPEESGGPASGRLALLRKRSQAQSPMARPAAREVKTLRHSRWERRTGTVPARTVGPPGAV
eukprot:5365162-Lingulodinium_polyedra.AAC.1